MFSHSKVDLQRCCTANYAAHTYANKRVNFIVDEYKTVCFRFYMHVRRDNIVLMAFTA